MNILLVNDDGYHAPGINALKEELAKKHTVYVVAPSSEKSTTGHSMSLSRPLQISSFGDKEFSLDGFPGDCTLFGLAEFKNIDLVVSGANRGGNLSQDIYYSGTVAGAREASFHNIPSISCSVCFEFGDNETLKKAKHNTQVYRHAAEAVCRLIDLDIIECIGTKQLINLNFPPGSFKNLVYCELGHRIYSEMVQKREDPRGNPYAWVMGNWKGHEENERSDCHFVSHGDASITLLNNFGYEKTPGEKLRNIIDNFNS